MLFKWNWLRQFVSIGYFSAIFVSLSILLTAFPEVQAGNAAASCRHTLATDSKGQSQIVWDVITDRDFDYNRLTFETMNKMLKIRPGNRIPEFHLKDVLEGRKSLLSLGEGMSDFIREILFHSEVLQKKEVTPEFAVDAVAVDISYLQPESQSYFIGKLPNRMQSRYVGQAFQELDLKTADGKRAQFDEVFSSWSLIFVLEKMMEVDREAALQIMIRIFDHIKSGGVLRVFPINTSDVLLLVKQLESLGLVDQIFISNMKHPKNRRHFDFINIQKI
ncbi:MAG: hypothetical protein AB7F59_13885 [Bdellovibrionales bacterium]